MRITLTKTAILSAATALLGLAGMSAASAADFEDFARVINVVPQVEQINMPHQECRTEYENVQRQQPQRERSTGGSIIGGIAGGLLGSQVGGGNGRIAAAAAGALTGAIVGDRVDNNGNNDYGRPQTTYESQPVRRCANIDRWETRNNGYAVTYEYHNRTYTSIMPYDPGSRLRLHVSLTPRP
ncbi:glycine zipper 2TM domain-containing protein [Undibacterium sp. Jales W-56]|uniref:glycine zipper 2TM domain-containing protein n=1 Tax=Undibacterium sp. Jales W-56 TaxID=2897325 RepID=UPI0021D30E7C|nr:glycine zipper 2TM domain-containing protein [Undibacterium sp. Jales W-56]MCU6434094.1 glycine zipper 2TM domain-containing protein [Undibacterium sp. Jales W-56]